MELEIQVGRKKDILDRATSLFEKNGYTASSMRDLAKDVGIEAGSLYSHFSGKEAILKSICFKMANDYLNSLDPILELDLSPKDKLELAIQSHIRVLTKDPKASSVFQHDWKYMTGENLAEFLKMRQQYEEGFQKILKDGLSSKEFFAEDEKFLLLTILSAINWTSQWYQADGKFKPDQIAKMLSNILIKGISKAK